MKIWGERNTVGDFKGGSIETATEHPFTVYWLELTWLPLEAGKYLYSGKPCTQVKTYHHRRKKEQILWNNQLLPELDNLPISLTKTNSHKTDTTNIIGLFSMFSFYKKEKEKF